MPPVLTTSSRNYDYDYDLVQPVFLDGEEEDFYPPPRCQLLPGPSEDIWKKFELMPTPPLSPSRRSSLCDVTLSAAEHLEGMSDLLDEDCNPSATFLQSFIIQDCMWSSSFAAATQLEKVVSERLASLRKRRDCSTNADRAGEQQLGAAQVSLQDLSAAATDCIDPPVVFPCSPLTTKSNGGAAVEAASEVCLDSPPLSSSDTESGEEQEDEEDNEEDEEVIDVVTVDRRKASLELDGGPDSSQMVLKRSHINILQQPPATLQQPAGKRIKSQDAGPTLRRSGGHSCCSPRSDGEDGDKRRTHNVLERQRRNEINRSFRALREQIPALADNHKTAKVAILKEATEFITEVRLDEERLMVMKDELRKRSRELKDRMKQLRTEHSPSNQ